MARGIPLIHRELWEGLLNLSFIFTIICFLCISGFGLNHTTRSKNIGHGTKISLHKDYSNNKSKNSLIWVYDLKDLSLVEGAPYKSKSECAKVLQINRSTVATYLDTEKSFKNRFIFSSINLNEKELSKWVVPSKTWEVVTGELLGDGHISYNPINTPQINGRLEFTFSAQILHYIKYLKRDALAGISNESEPTPWPNPEKTNKEPSQYWFSTKRLPAISELHRIWYKYVDGKFVKILPFNIKELLTPVSIAHWIMGDGYFDGNTLKLCTDNFTKEEVLILIKILDEKFGIKATINKRSNPNNSVVWRIRINKVSIEKLKLLVSPYFIPEMLYKLGIKK